jgi:hypothetical protein
VLELALTEAEIVRCFARPDVLDGLPPLANAYACRIARDEVMLVAPGDSVREHVSTFVQSADPAALVAEQSDGWAMWTLVGEEAAGVFENLSAIPVPSERPGFAQGEIGGVPARAIVLDDRIHLLVVSSLAHHIRDRVRAVCADVVVQA